jgi:hypothetical protein
MESKFISALQFLKPVATGTKASNDTVPTVTLLGIPNKFQLNRLATKALDLNIGDRIRIFDNKNAESLDERYFIAKTSVEDPASAKIGRANSGNKASSGVDMTFNYAGVWSSLVQGEVDAVELGYDALAEKDCVIKGTTTGGREKYRATKTIKLEIVEVGEAEIEGVTYKVHVMTNFKSTDKTPEELEEEMKASEKAAAGSLGDLDDDDDDPIIIDDNAPIVDDNAPIVE